MLGAERRFTAPVTTTFSPAANGPPGVLLATHVVVVREERSLDARFATAYRSYRSSVRRYL